MIPLDDACGGMKEFDRENGMKDEIICKFNQ